MLFQRLLFQHAPQLSTAAQPHALVVDGIEAVEVVSRHVDCFDHVASQDARAVDAVVEPLEAGEDAVVEGVDEAFVGDVDGALEDVGRWVNAQDVMLGLGQRGWVDVGDGESGAA